MDKISRMTEIEDLQAPHDLPLAPLCIKVSAIFCLCLDHEELAVSLLPLR